MKNINFRQVLPHLVAVIVFLLLSVFLTKPTLEGKAVQQGDVIQWRAMAQQAFEYKEKNGHFPKWTNSMMSGMPTYQIALGPKEPMNIHLHYIQDILTFGLPKPVFYLFIASLCFYILCIVIGINPWVSILGGIAYSYCSYDAVLIAGGHDSKLMSMAYAPAVLAGLQLIFKQKYWLGSAVLLISGVLLLSQLHQQIVYYTLLMVVFMTIPFIIKCIREKKIKHLAISSVISISMGAVMLGTMALLYWPTYEFTKETMRGGRSELTQKDKKNETKGGLDKDYAFRWSYGKAETMTMLIPNAFGASSSEGLGDNSKAIQVLQENQSLPQGFAQQIAQSSPMYWGELPTTQGTVYMGAIICLLFLFGAFLSKSEHKWWLVAITVFGIVLAWGRNFEAVNYFLFDHLPFYKKFRAPSMALVIPQLSVPLLASIFLNEFVSNTDKEKLQQLVKKCLYITGATAAVIILFYFFSDFTNDATNDLRKNINEQLQGQGTDFTRSYFNALKSDRQAFYLSDMWRTLSFMFVCIAVLYMYAKKMIKPAIVYAALIIFCTIDLFVVSKRYLKEENFVEATDLESSYVDTHADLQLRNDTSYYRVINLAFPNGSGGYGADINSSFNDAIASYKHNTIGGYSPAKLGLYQDLIERQLYKNIQAWATNSMAKDSFPVLNMLNMKYAIVPDQRDPRQNQAVLNPFALGNCWLVKQVKFVKNADEEMNALNSFDPTEVAFVDEKFKAAIPFTPVYDSAASIKLLENKTDEMKYEFNAATNQFAVFSEIYYPLGWKAFIDGKETPYCKTNYVLRGLAIPAGKHTIDFIFDPASVRVGEKISRYTNIISVLIVLFCFFMVWKNRNKTTGNLKA